MNTTPAVKPPVNPLAKLDEVKPKSSAIRIVTSWEVGVMKDTLVKFNLPYTDENRDMMPHGLRRGPDREQAVEDQLHINYARAMGQNHKTVEGRDGERPTDTADEKMETPDLGQVTARTFWAELHSLGFMFLDGQYFRHKNQQGQWKWVVELRFVQKRNLARGIEALKSIGVKPTPYNDRLRSQLLEGFFSRRWWKCHAFSNSAHIDKTKTYNFVGIGRKGPLLNLRIDEKDQVRFMR